MNHHNTGFREGKPFRLARLASRQITETEWRGSAKGGFAVKPSIPKTGTVEMLMKAERFVVGPSGRLVVLASHCDLRLRSQP